MELFILLIIIGVLYGIWAIFREIIRAILLRNFKKKKVEPILPTVEKHLEMLNSLFVPNRYTSDEDIERFSEDTKETRDAVWNLYTKKPTIFNEYLDTTSIKPYKKLVTLYELKKRQKENNAIADAIEKLKALSSKATETYKALTDDNHYFTYSEMEEFKQSLIEVETLSKAVLPKYVEYLGEDEKNLLGIYNGIEAERKLHNQSFIQKELTENKTYFDTV